MSSPSGPPPRVIDPARRPWILVVVGTRPEAIKMFPLVRALRDHPRFRPFVVSTGQHPGLVEEVLDLADIPVDANLGVARPGLTLNELFAAVVGGVEELCAGRFGPASSSVNGRDLDVYPFACMVHGDTSSAAAAALAAFHLRIPVIHVEAGLRTGTTLTPYPEELNRQLIARIATWHLAPTAVNQQNLVREGIDIRRVFVTGNTGIDALQATAALRTPYTDPALVALEHDDATRVVVVTAHRRENWGAGLERIATAVARLAEEYPDTRFVLPLHPNPVVAGTLRPILEPLANVALVAPIGYGQFSRLLERAYLVITDSGGIQEEAPALRTAVLVTRDQTERGEGVTAGTLELVGTDVERIVTAAERLLDDPDHYLEVVGRPNPYGDGRASERIVAAMDDLAFETPAAAPAPFGPGYDAATIIDAAGYDRTAVDVPRGLPPARSQDAIDGVHQP